MIEVLIVMTVFTIILSFSVITIKSFWEHMQKRLFISQFQSDLYYAHSYAINRQETMVVKFTILNNLYEVVAAESNKTLIRRKMPKPIYLAETNI